MSDTLDDNPGKATKFTLAYVDKVLQKFPFLSVSDRDQVIASLRDGRQVLLHLDKRPDSECFLFVAKVGEGLYSAKLLTHSAGQLMLAASKVLWSLEEPEDPEH